MPSTLFLDTDKGIIITIFSTKKDFLLFLITDTNLLALSAYHQSEVVQGKQKFTHDNHFRGIFSLHLIFSVKEREPCVKRLTTK